MPTWILQKYNKNKIQIFFWLLLKMSQDWPLLTKITPTGDHYNVFSVKPHKNLHTSKIEMRITIGNIRYTRTVCFHTTQVIA